MCRKTKAKVECNSVHPVNNEHKIWRIIRAALLKILRSDWLTELLFRPGESVRHNEVAVTRGSSVITLANHEGHRQSINQSKPEGNTFSWRKARENVCRVSQLVLVLPLTWWESNTENQLILTQCLRFDLEAINVLLSLVHVRKYLTLFVLHFF